MSLLVKLPDDPSPTFAEISTVNWILALYSEIVNEHGQDYASWKSSLGNHFNKINKHTSSITNREIFQKCFHAICLANSIKSKYNNNYFNHCDVVGTISDFYYGLYNTFIGIAMSNGFPEGKTHGKNNSNFSSTKNTLPYPLNIRSDFVSTSWNGKKLISEDNFENILPGKTSRIGKGNSNLNKYQSGILLSSSTAQDMIMTYLRGSCNYEIWRTLEELKSSKKIQNFRTQANRDLANPRLQRVNSNLMQCMFRYRTKAHYRDFVYLTYDYTDDKGYKNNYLSIDYYFCLYTILEFCIATHITYLVKRLGRATVKDYLDDISLNLKDSVPPNNVLLET